jgi:hypothetical protein
MNNTLDHIQNLNELSKDLDQKEKDYIKNNYDRIIKKYGERRQGNRIRIHFDSFCTIRLCQKRKETWKEKGFWGVKEGSRMNGNDYNGNFEYQPLDFSEEYISKTGTDDLGWMKSEMEGLQHININKFKTKTNDFEYFKSEFKSNNFWFEHNGLDSPLIISVLEEIEKLILESKYEVNLIQEKKSKLSLELDKDNNGQLDLIEGGDDFLTLLKKHQQKIIEIDRTYIQNFIKVSNYLTKKKENLQVIFVKLKDSKNQSQIDEFVDILNHEIYTYNVILLNSLHLINSLVEDDMITFYEIYERFDKLNMFTSNWENQVTEKLEQVNVNLNVLMKELREVGNRIVSSIENLSFITEESNRKLTSKMSEIDSTLQVGNLLNLIQTYQMYKVNKNTKSLRE